MEWRRVRGVNGRPDSGQRTTKTLNYSEFDLDCHRIYHYWTLPFLRRQFRETRLSPFSSPPFTMPYELMASQCLLHTWTRTGWGWRARRTTEKHSSEEVYSNIAFIFISSSLMKAKRKFACFRCRRRRRRMKIICRCFSWCVCIMHSSAFNFILYYENNLEIFHPFPTANNFLKRRERASPEGEWHQLCLWTQNYVAAWDASIEC